MTTLRRLLGLAGLLAILACAGQSSWGTPNQSGNNPITRCGEFQKSRRMPSTGPRPTSARSALIRGPSIRSIKNRSAFAHIFCLTHIGSHAGIQSPGPDRRLGDRLDVDLIEVRGAIVGQRCVIHGLSVIGAGAVTASGTVIDGQRVPAGV